MTKALFHSKPPQAHPVVEPHACSHATVELTNDRDHIIWHAKTGEYCPEEGSINGVVRFGKVDKAYIQRNSFFSAPAPATDACTMNAAVDSIHVLFFTLTDRASTIPSNVRGCQSGTWSRRGTKVNGSHHGDNPLLRPTGIQIARKSYANLQSMAPTNIKTVHQTSLLHIESSLDRLGLLSPTHDQRSQQQTGQITFQPLL